jgi:hypothetical protein
MALEVRLRRRSRAPASQQPDQHEVNLELRSLRGDDQHK